MNLMNRRDAEAQSRVADRGSVSRSGQECAVLLRIIDLRSDADNSSLGFSSLRLFASAVKT
jgi:hypothetical protein